MSAILSIFRWLLLAPFDFMVGLLAFPLAPLIVLLTSASGVSPFLAWPWLTPDNPIDGDAGHISRWPRRIGQPVPRWYLLGAQWRLVGALRGAAGPLARLHPPAPRLENTADS